MQVQQNKRRTIIDEHPDRPRPIRRRHHPRIPSPLQQPPQQQQVRFLIIDHQDPLC